MYDVTNWNVTLESIKKLKRDEIKVKIFHFCHGYRVFYETLALIDWLYTFYERYHQQ